MRIRSHKDVAIYALIITAIAIATTAGFVHFATHDILRPRGYRFAMFLATGLPFVIALPISILSLLIVRYIGDALQKVEAFVKFDALTGVLARSYFMESVRTRFGEGGALMLVDADHFKKVNDTFGHDIGDEALKVIGAALNLAASSDTFVGRIGGEEFAIFVPGASAAEAEAMAGRLCAGVQENGRVVAGHAVGLTVSIGIAMILPNSTLTLTLKAADQSLYCAKNAGRNQYVFSAFVPAADPVRFEPLKKRAAA